MGLCKCPKRRVTNQFCFEHRVNVCEFCMVTNHPKCVVQSYLQWLQDSDYNPICELCTKELESEDCVRLICYPSNLVSPVADVLREKLAGVNWARAGLGLPLLSEEKQKGDNVNTVHNENNNDNKKEDVLNSFSQQSSPKRSVASDEGFESNHVPNSKVTDISPHSVVHVEDSVSAFSRTESYPGQQPHRVFEALDDSKDMLFDHDENKYKRRSALEWFSRWWKSIGSPSSRGRRNTQPLYRRYWMAAILFIVGLLTLIMIFSWLGRIATANDPNLDIHQNPNIHTQE
ncbi:Uncharacterized protein GBIM_08222 [Gryllus bimaculatus]|nr:Uncharacterized protein GBIM_08222 [Gryllus bimaculatus]